MADSSGSFSYNIPLNIVENAAQVELGPHVRVAKYRFADMVAPGDNFATIVKSVQVTLQAPPLHTKEKNATNSDKSSRKSMHNNEINVNGDRTADETVETGKFFRPNGVHNSGAVGGCGKPSTKEENGIIVTKETDESRNNISKPNFTKNTCTNDKYTVNKEAENCPDFKVRRIQNGHVSDQDELPNIWSCVVKLNSQKESIFFKIFSKFAFQTEVHFYSEILPKLNNELLKSNQSSLRTPKYLASDQTDDNEVLLLEDLRLAGYHVEDKSKGMTMVKASMAIKEVARLHAASVLHAKHTMKIEQLVQASQSNGDIEKSQRDSVVTSENSSNYAANLEKKKTELFGENFLTVDGPLRNLYTALFKERIQTTLPVLEQAPSMEEAVKWLKEVDNNIPLYLKKLQGDCEPQFRVLCHGDTWTNNFLFSESSKSSYLLDFQLVHPSSLGIDINFLLYTSCLGYSNHLCQATLLATYYTQYQGVMEAQRQKAGFTLSELTAEVARTRPWGVMGAVTILPMIFPPPPPQQQEEKRQTQNLKDSRQEQQQNENHQQQHQHQEATTNNSSNATQQNGMTSAGQQLPRGGLPGAEAGKDSADITTQHSSTLNDPQTADSNAEESDSSKTKDSASSNVKESASSNALYSGNSKENLVQNSSKSSNSCIREDSVYSEKVIALFTDFMKS